MADNNPPAASIIPMPTDDDLASERELIYGPQIANRILAALPPDEYQRILPKLEEVSLVLDTMICDFGDPIHYVYFPCSGMIALLASVEDDHTTIAAIIGSEGMHGLPLFLGSKIAPVRAVVQGNGIALRMKVSDFEEECKIGGELSLILLSFTLSILVQVLQSTVCYRFHSTEQRLARWLLMMSDRMHSDRFQLTHNYLASMVGVRRESVTTAAGLLRKKSLISYNRGSMTILDRRALEASACKCYTIIRDAEQRVTG